LIVVFEYFSKCHPESAAREMNDLMIADRALFWIEVR
jgi:hypothetical protein